MQGFNRCALCGGRDAYYTLTNEPLCEDCYLSLVYDALDAARTNMRRSTMYHTALTTVQSYVENTADGFLLYGKGR